MILFSSALEPTLEYKIIMNKLIIDVASEKIFSAVNHKENYLEHYLQHHDLEWAYKIIQERSQ